MKHKLTLLEPDCMCHVYNRAIGNERMFVDDANYRFFMEQYKRYLKPIVDTHCYCLMPNHFHFLLRVKGEGVLKDFFKNQKLNGDLTGFKNLSGLVSRQFSNFFNSYSKAFNKKYGRKGSLFIRPFSRLQVTNDQYLKKLVFYIHFNPVEAGLARHPQDWRYSSYPAITSDKATMVKRDEVLEYFGGRDNFIHCHKYPPELTGMEDF